MSLNLDAPQLQWTDPRGPCARPGVHERLARRRGLGPDLVRQGVLQRLVPARPPGERLSDAARHRSASGCRPRASRRIRSTRFLAILGNQAVPSTVGGVTSDKLSDQGSRVRQHRLRAAGSTRGSAFNLSFNGSWNKQRPVIGSGDVAPGERRRAHELARRAAGAAHDVLRRRHPERDVGRRAAVAQLRRPVSLAARRTRARELRVRRRHERRADRCRSAATRRSTARDAPRGDFRRRTSSRGSAATTSIASSSRASCATTAASQDQASNLLGTFSFNSLADLEAGRAGVVHAAARRARERDVGQLVGGLSLGDSWRKSSNLQIQYGVRLDGNRFLDRPDAQPGGRGAVRRAQRPRAERAVRQPARRLLVDATARPRQIAGFEGAARGPRAVVRGGIGVFQNTPQRQPDRQRARQHRAAEWRAAAHVRRRGGADPGLGRVRARTSSSIPDRCADGTTGTVFSNAAPNVSLFANDYRRAAQRALEPVVERPDPRQPLLVQRRRRRTR